MEKPWLFMQTFGCQCIPKPHTIRQGIFLILKFYIYNNECILARSIFYLTEIFSRFPMKAKREPASFSSTGSDMLPFR